MLLSYELTVPGATVRTWVGLGRHGTTNHMPGSRTSIGSEKSSRLRRLIEVSLPGMIRRKLPPVLLVSLIVGVLLGIIWLVLNRDIGVEEQVALEFDASSPQVVVAPGETYTQRFGATSLALRGFVIYVPSDHNPGNITVTVANTITHRDVTSYRYTTTVRGDSQRLTFTLPHLATKPKDVLVATITNRGDYPLPLQSHKPGIITFSTLQPVEPSVAYQTGLLAAVVVGLVFLLIDLLPIKPAVTGPAEKHNTSQQWWLARAALLLLPLLATPGFWFATGQLGVGDWDYRFSLHEIYRRSITVFHQFPFWNPYTCGGTSGLSDPEFSGASPTFLLELLFGIPLGTKMGIYLGLCVVGVGMINVAKSLRLSWRGALLSAIIVTYSSAFVLKIVEGHVTIIYAFMWVPWILWAWYNALHSPLALPSSPRLRPANFYAKDSRAARYEARKGSQGGSSQFASAWPIIGGVFLSLAFYQGGIYVLTYTVLALLLAACLVTQRGQAIRATMVMGLWSIGFSAIKLLPVLYWLKYFPDAHYVASTSTVSHLIDIFFRRHLHGSYILPGQLSGWHEYGAYIGFIVVALSLVALASLRQSRLRRSLLLLLLIGVSVASLGPLLQPLFDYLPFIPRSNISRVNLFTVLALALLAGLGLDRIYRPTPSRRSFSILIAALVAFDLCTYSAILSDQTFTLPNVFPAPSPAPSPLAYSNIHHTINKNGNEYYRSYPMTKAGYGSFSFCSVLGPKSQVATMSGDTVPAYLTARGGKATLRSWSPNALTIDYTVPQDSQVVVNMNYAPGWHVGGNAAKNDDGLLAAEVRAGQGQLNFRYRPPLFFLGAILTVFSIMAALFLGIRRRYE